MGKQKFSLLVSSDSDIPPEIIEKYNITVIPIHIIFGEKKYTSTGFDKGLSLDEYYSMVDDIVPTTAIPSPGIFHQKIQEALDKGETVFGFFISHKISGVYVNAKNIADKMFPEADIHLYDTRVNSTGIALITMEVAKLIEAGKSKEEILAKIDEWIPQLQFNGIMNTIENLVRTGRISKAKKFFADLLNFKPVCGYVNYEVTVHGQIRADDDLIVSQMKKYGKHALANINPETSIIFVSHSRWPEAAEQIKEYMEQHNTDKKQIIVQETGVINSFYTGRKLIVISYIGKFDENWLLKTK